MDWHEYKKTLSIYNEKTTHPKTRADGAHLFHSTSYESAEIEYLDLLHSLIVAQKPRFVLETGTNLGISTTAISFAQKSNSNELGEAFLTISIEVDSALAQKAEGTLRKLSLDEFTKVAIANSTEYLANQNPSQQYDLVFFDSSRLVRIKEFYILHERKLFRPNALLVFHDTGKYTVSERPEDQTIQETYLQELRRIESYCQGKLSFNLSRGLTIFQYNRA